MRTVAVGTVLTALALIGLSSPAAAQPAGETVTFTEHVAPIFYESCTTCHRPGQVAPMSLLTYEDARPWDPRDPPEGRPPREGAFPISRSRAHTHWRHGHPLQTVPSAGLIERPQEKNRVDALR